MVPKIKLHVLTARRRTMCPATLQSRLLKGSRNLDPTSRTQCAWASVDAEPNKSQDQNNLCQSPGVKNQRPTPEVAHPCQTWSEVFCQHRIGQTLTFCLVCLCNKMKSINHDLNCSTTCWINVYIACFCVFAEYIFYWHSLVLFWSHSLFSSLFSLRACNSSGCCCSGGQARGESPL